MSNSITFIGRLTRDSEKKDVGSGLLSFSVANDVGFGDKKVTNFFNCNIWGKRAETLSAHLTKGKQIVVYGELQLRKYEKDGVERISPDVNVSNIDFAGSNGGNNSDDSDDDSVPF